MFGSDKDDNQTNAPSGDTGHPSVGVSEKQIEELSAPAPAPVIPPTAPPPSEPLAPAPDQPALASRSADAGAAPLSEPDTPPPPAEPPADVPEDLMNLKQQALHSLAPLVSQLEQTPEEKFKTTMMLIQASDNAELIKDAYEAANAIPDEKTRAQALLDVVNEINYFTQHKDQK